MLLFCKANHVEWRRIFKLLENCEVTLGQKLNLNKTSIFFGRNISEAKRQEISFLSRLQAIQRYDTYLGLLALVGKSRVRSFKSIKHRVWNRLNSWKVKFLSQARKEILLKAVIQTIPTYSISVLKLPHGFYKELHGLMHNLWWGHKSNTKKIHWMSWEWMGFSKTQGRLGFRDLVTFNQALLATQCW
jgi:hypothetical protein